MDLFVVPASLILPLGISDIPSSICAREKSVHVYARARVCVFISVAAYLQIHVLPPSPRVLISGNILDFEVMAGCWDG